MGKFIIKVTYLEGEHAASEYFMIKGGYVTDHPESVSDDSAYTEKACKMICTKYANKNEREVRMETLERERREKDGKTNSKYRIYYPSKYEPYEIGKSEAIEEAEEIEITEAEEVETAQEAEVKESESEKVFEFTTWQYGKEWEEAERKAIAAAKNHKGEKFTVAIGEWGSRTFLVLADSKEEAKALAIEYYNATNKTEEPADKVKVRNVTNCKKYK